MQILSLILEKANIFVLVEFQNKSFMMRFVYLFFLCITMQAVYSQNQFNAVDVSYTKALETAKSEHKPLFIMLYADWCPHCNVMKKEVFSDAAVQTFLNQNFICVWKNIEKEEGIQIKNKFNTNSLPSFLFLDSNETLLYALKGEMKKDSFLKEAQYALNPKMQLPYLEKEYKADPSNPIKFLNYLTILRKGKERSAVSEATAQYFKTQTDAQLVSEINWRIITNGISDIQSREFQYVLNHQKEFAAVASQSRIDKKVENIVKELLRPLVDIEDTISYYKQREIAKSIHLQKTDSLIFKFDLAIAEKTNNWAFYKKTTLENTETLAWNDVNLLKEIGQVYLKNIAEVASLKKAIAWVKRSLELNDTYDGNLLLARLYQKTKDKKLALKFAKAAKVICTEMTWNSKEVDALLSELETKQQTK